MIHMEYYLVVSTIMMFAGIYGFFTRRNTLASTVFSFREAWKAISLHSFPSLFRLRKRL